MTKQKTNILRINKALSIVAVSLFLCSCDFNSNSESHVFGNWVSGNGELIVKFYEEYNFEIYPLGGSKSTGYWCMEDSLIRLEAKSGEINTFLIIYSIKDTLILDVGKPRGYLIKNFYSFNKDNFKFKDKEYLFELLNGKMYEIYIDDNSHYSTVLFNKDGGYKIKSRKGLWEEKNGTWRVMKNDEIPLILMTVNQGESLIARLVDIKDEFYTLKVYSTKDNIHFYWKLKKVR